MATSTVKKSVAATVSQWAVRNVRQGVRSPLSGAGSMPCSRRIFAMVLLATVWSRFERAPRIRVYPHFGICGAPHILNYVNRADMWTWAGHASSCGSLSPRASHKFSQRSMRCFQPKPRTESSAQHFGTDCRTRRGTTLRSGRRGIRTAPVQVPTVTDSGASGTMSSSGSWTDASETYVK